VLPPLAGTGAIFRLDNDLSIHKVIDGISIPNGITWSKDNKTMYLSDSPTQNIYAYDYDEDTGEISNKRVFFHVEDEHGQPDGQALDSDGNLWSAIFGMGIVVKLSAEGNVLATVKLPTRCVTCPVFVDDWIYVTTAEEEEPDRFPSSIRFQGRLFRCKVGVRGHQINRFKASQSIAEYQSES
jgi:sugar lactone lactonase YvrE